MKITDLLGRRHVRVLFKVVPEIDFTGKRFKIFFCDSHARVVKITARKQNVDLILVEKLELVSDQGVAELDHGDRMQLGMVCIFGEQIF